MCTSADIKSLHKAKILFQKKVTKQASNEMCTNRKRVRNAKGLSQKYWRSKLSLDMCTRRKLVKILQPLATICEPKKQERHQVTQLEVATTKGTGRVYTIARRSLAQPSQFRSSLLVGV